MQWVWWISGNDFRRYRTKKKHKFSKLSVTMLSYWSPESWGGSWWTQEEQVLHRISCIELRTHWQTWKWPIWWARPCSAQVLRAQTRFRRLLDSVSDKQLDLRWYLDLMGTLLYLIAFYVPKVLAQRSVQHLTCHCSYLFYGLRFRCSENASSKADVKFLGTVPYGMSKSSSILTGISKEQFFHKMKEALFAKCDELFFSFPFSFARSSSVWTSLCHSTSARNPMCVWSTENVNAISENSVGCDGCNGTMKAWRDCSICLAELTCGTEERMTLQAFKKRHLSYWR